jgi:hypothetical protein
VSRTKETVLLVPRLRAASVVAGGCCPVPAEALLVPELEAVPGVNEADADWSSARVRVRHAEDVPPGALAAALAELGYPAESWSTRWSGAVE